MKIGVIAVTIASAAAVWFWPEVAARLAPQQAAAHSASESGLTLRSGEDLAGRVVGVTDGDTLTLLTAERRQVRVRLVEIDAPESDQPWGARAKQALSHLVFGRTVRVAEHGLDRYGRTLGRVYADGKDVNAELVRQGAAWAYREYLNDPSLLRDEGEARAAHRGLWSLETAQQQAPWDWRHDMRTGVSHTVALRTSVGACEAKRYCSQMGSCAEARHYLTSCGATRLDGDGDGVPCEALCTN